MTSTHGPLDIIVAAFDTESGADEAFQRLTQAHQPELINIDNAAIIRKDAHGTVRLAEPEAHPVRAGIGRGALLGAALGLLFPPSVLAGAAVGAAVGGLVGKLRDTGLDDHRLRQAAEELTPSSSALIAVIEHHGLADLLPRLDEAGADVTTTTITADIARHLQAHAAAREW